MKDKTIWDYSHIPKRIWKWFFVRDHWMEVEIAESGLNYFGTDWTCQSGGGYFGGFQTFDEFLTNNPLQKMPNEIAKDVGDHIRKYRTEGGATLRLVYVQDVNGYQLLEVFVHLDDNPIHIKRVREKGEMLIFDGSIKPGKHCFSFVFVLRSVNDQKKIDGEVFVTVQQGANNAVVKTSQDDEGTLITEIVSD